MAILAASAALLALAACGKKNEANEMAANMAAENAMMNEASVNAMSMNEMAANTMANMAAPAVPATGQDYATMAAASDMYEIESSKLAQEKSKNADVKAFAKMLVTDHEKATADLKTAAGKAEPKITVTPALDAEQKANMEALRGASAADFDRLYLQQQVPAHEKALAMLQGYAQSGDVASLKDHASKTAAVVQKHLTQARDLMSKMK